MSAPEEPAPRDAWPGLYADGLTTAEVAYLARCTSLTVRRELVLRGVVRRPAGVHRDPA
jgi:hypothetical protein